MLPHETRHVGGSNTSSILAGIPPPKPSEAVASIRAIFALWESALRPCGDLCCFDGTDLASVFSAAPDVLGRCGDAEAADSLSLF